ncbi:ROK family protein [Ferruginibacter paludis]|uniref:ROK family protein n=1 Tax=Ferruginibacter paludis TaxID=1310417 RepID=UPI0025B4C6C5|nr:ROK family protein [Ferruginibacter paludis]MDN3655567.1 ROK family protein [Ferruginibacter paludis]
MSIIIEKSFPLTQKLIEELVADNLVTETGYAVSSGGRRPLTYAIQRNVMYMVAVAMDQFVTKIAVIDMQNHLVSSVTRIFLSLTETRSALQVLIDKIAGAIDTSGIPKEKFIGIGIGMPGFIDVKKGINYSFLSLPDNESITKHMAFQLGLPVFIDNDSSLIALAELRFGAAKGARNAMVINIGWGVGLGLILNGALYRGHEGFAGEFSHIPLFLNGKLCWCGKAGCLETETSLLLIKERAIEGINSGRVSRLNTLSLENHETAYQELIKAVQEGDQFTIELFSKAGYNIGKGVAVLIHLLNPQKIILSGRGSAAGKIWEAPIQQALNEHCIRRLFQNTNIEISDLGLEAQLIGAAALVMENYNEISFLKEETTGFELSQL